MWSQKQFFVIVLLETNVSNDYWLVFFFFASSLSYPSPNSKKAEISDKMKMLQNEQTSESFLVLKTLQNYFSFFSLVSSDEGVFRKKEDFFSNTCETRFMQKFLDIVSQKWESQKVKILLKSNQRFLWRIDGKWCFLVKSFTWGMCLSKLLSIFFICLFILQIQGSECRNFCQKWKCCKKSKL